MPINEQIRAKQMLVIGPNGEQLGIKSKEEALTLASYAGFDLVLINDKGENPVCKLMDYNKFKYEKKKNGKIPAVFAVIDKLDTPVETKVIGDWIIAETRNNKWTIWSGESYVCIEKVENKEEKPQITEEKASK